jgi:probable HAF family extracellular repeat protein
MCVRGSAAVLGSVVIAVVASAGPASSVGPAIHAHTPSHFAANLGMLEPVDLSDSGDVIAEGATRSGEMHAFFVHGGVTSDLGTLGGDRSSPTRLNNNGLVIGMSRAADGVMHGFAWRGGKMTDLGANTVPGAVNDRDQVAGTTGPAGDRRVFVWQSGRFTDLGAPPGSLYIPQVLMNRHGHVAAVAAYPGLTPSRAVLWRGGRLIDLGVISAEIVNIEITGINDHDQIIGTTQPDLSTPRRGFVWSDGRTTQLRTLGGATSRPIGIDNRGRIVGTADDTTGKQHLVAWDNSRILDLGTLPAGSTVYDVNDSGQAVGDWPDAVQQWQHHAALWQHGRTTELPWAHDASSFALAINDKSQVLGAGSRPQDEVQSYAVLWTPRRYWTTPWPRRR